jgi:glycolate oxidase FAD binding subunit
LELESLDVRWSGDGGAVLARAAGVAADGAAGRAARLMREAGLHTEVDDDDEALWAGQRALQRSAGGAVVRVSSVPTELGRTVEAARAAGATVAGRAGLGLWWVGLPAAADPDLSAAITGLRAALAPRPCVLQDAPQAVRAAAGVWGEVDAATLALMRRLKARFDPAGTCNPGIFVGGI